ncbi:MAG: hypothetical protein GJ676_13030 [Rhodobacteraceae bacterium]|nr:hypothetical protein [Paracoccaceae bacterium]
MQKLGDMMAHVRLMSRMGKTVGVDLVRAHDAGLMSQEDWADLVQSCRGCDWARCPDWLDRHGSVETAPKTCPNHARFAELKTQLQELDDV